LLLNDAALQPLSPLASTLSKQAIMNAQLLSQARQLSVQDQLELLEKLWEDIAERDAIPTPTDAQKAELDKRLADHLADPDDVVSWNDVKASALVQIGR
jgi:putative addiction module component (TIGR02574 family)